MSARASRWVGLIAACALASRAGAGEPPASPPPAMPLPQESRQSVGSSPAAPPAIIGLSVADLAAAATGVLHQDGSADPAALSELLTQINRMVSGRLAFAPDRGEEGDEAASDGPLGGGTWRLWAFWAVDVPSCEGLAAALIAVRASGVAQVRPVHLCSLVAWDAWMGRMDAERSALGASARSQDQAACDRIGAAWRAEVAPFDAMLGGFYRRGVHLIGDASVAIALRVDAVPCLRLISPRQRVHALSGFAPGEDLVTWVRACQAWEAERDARAARPAQP